MECLDYTRVDSPEEIRDQIRSLMEQQKLNAQEADSVLTEDILRFTDSSLGKRMRRAALHGALYREQPFVISMGAAELNQGWPKED